MSSSWNYGKRSLGSIIFDTCNILFMIFLMVVTIYPFLYVIFASFSEPMRILTHRGPLFAPLGFSLRGYYVVFKTNTILNGYGVPVWLAVVGTACNMLMTVIFAYVLSRKGMMWHGPLTVMVIITMYFGGGMIPTYLVVRNLRLIDSLWSLVLPGAIGTFNMIIIRTAFRGVPLELEESARLDGAGELRILWNVILPLTVPTLAAITLFYAVGHWNSWATSLIYIQSPNKYPLQLVLRSILIQNDTAAMMSGVVTYESGEDYATRMLLKYSTIVVAVVPIMCVYPFLQKYFTKGVMIGALKG